MAHSHTHLASLRPWVLAQDPLRLGGGFCSGTRTREDVEERVPLGVDLLAAVARERLAQDASMGGQQFAVQVALVREQLRRAFDVREQKGDRATLDLTRKPHLPSHEHRAQPGPCQRRGGCQSGCVSQAVPAAISIGCAERRDAAMRHAGLGRERRERPASRRSTP